MPVDAPELDELTTCPVMRQRPLPAGRVPGNRLPEPIHDGEPYLGRSAVQDVNGQYPGPHAAHREAPVEV